MKTFKEFIQIAEGQFGVYGQVRYGSTPGTATDKSISSAVDKALANPGTSQSASETKGKTGFTGSVDVNYSGGRNARPQSQTTSSSARPTTATSVRPNAGVRPVPNNTPVRTDRSSTPPVRTDRSSTPPVRRSF